MILAVGLLPQSASPPCPADRPVDELIAEINSQTKRTTRNKNPLPDDICLFGWCTRAKRPHSQELAKGSAQAEQKSPSDNQAAEKKPESTADYSSSKSPEAKCDAAMELALAAAHDVDVADYQFEQKNYKGALLRLKAALADKPGDAAIHVRLGRVLERMNDPNKAIEHYQEAQKLPGPAKWTQEARSALQRLLPLETSRKKRPPVASQK